MFNELYAEMFSAFYPKEQLQKMIYENLSKQDEEIVDNIDNQKIPSGKEVQGGEELITPEALTEPDLVSELEAIKGVSRLQDVLIDYTLKTYQNARDMEEFFTDVLSHGYQAGTVKLLNTSEEARQFYADYKNEILELKTDYESRTGTTIKSAPNEDKETFLAYWAFQETMRYMLDKIGKEGFVRKEEKPDIEPENIVGERPEEEKPDIEQEVKPDENEFKRK